MFVVLLWLTQVTRLILLLKMPGPSPQLPCFVSFQSHLRFFTTLSHLKAPSYFINFYTRFFAYLAHLLRFHGKIVEISAHIRNKAFPLSGSGGEETV
jgi:hypothetical protein